MTLHVITACTRPWNLPLLASSMRAWGEVDLHWHIRLDPDHLHVGGQSLKNAMLDEISSGWVMFLDDDTTVHPDLYRRTIGAELTVPLMVRGVYGEPPAFVVSQQHSVLGLLEAAPENVEVGKIDIGQAILRRDVIGNHRIPESYAGDGEFLSAILPHCDAVYLEEVLSYHNLLG